ncbi:MAG TPA: DUF4406 domain-containing protein [Nocardioidaceae bacterium]|nr:DUF4406 domain-containing protein [Nocardioidaceae bacterium]
MEAWPLVYVAGPYTHPDPVLNVRVAVKAAEDLIAHRVVPLVPHLSHLWHLVSPQPYNWWLAYDLALLARCDAIYRIPGDSAGADGEVEWAQAEGMPVLWSLDEVSRFASACREAAS